MGKIMYKKLLLLTIVTCISATIQRHSLANADIDVTKKKIGSLSIPFVENKGQLSSNTAFAVRTFAGTTSVTRHGEIVYTLRAPRGVSIGSTLKERFVGGRAKPVANDLAETKINRFIGSDPKQWQHNIKTYNTVALGEVWRGVNVELQAHGNNVEKIFTVAPDQSPRAINVDVTGATSLSLDNDGSLIANTIHGPVTFTTPIAYQDINGERRNVNVSYALNGTRYGFALGRYDRSHAVVIDPFLQATYLGSAGGDFITAIKIDAAGNVFVAGFSDSTNLPGTGGAAQDTSGGGGNEDVFVAKFNPALTSLMQVTYLGGSNVEDEVSLALDSSNNVYVAGTTTSTDFPSTTGGAIATNAGADQDGFVVKLNNALTTITQATYLGGNSFDRALGITLDGSGNVFVTGETGSNPFPSTTGGVFASPSGNGDAFVAKLNNGLTTITQSTYLGGSNSLDIGQAIAIDSGGNVFVTGITGTTNFPGTTGGARAIAPAPLGNNAGFVAKLNNALTTLNQATYLSDSIGSNARALAIDNSGNVFVTGEARANDFPQTAGGAQPTAQGGLSLPFVASLNNTLTAINQATYLGGTAGGDGISLVLDGAGNIYVSGNSGAGLTGTAGGAKATGSGGYVAKLNTALTSLTQATYLDGGSTQASNPVIALDTSGNVYAAGDTDSTDLPNTTGSARPTSGGSTDGYVIRVTGDLSGTASPGQLQFAAATFAVTEGIPNATIQVTRTGGSNGAVAVNFSTANGTATAPADYANTATTVNFANGDSATKTINIPIVADAIADSGETVLLSLATPTGGAALGAQSSATLTISDAAPTTTGTLQFSASSSSVNEIAGSITLFVTRIGGSFGALSVTVVTANGTANASADYSSINQVLNFADGDMTAKTVMIPIHDDSLGEGNENFTVNLSGSALGAIRTQTVTIVDNEAVAVGVNASGSGGCVLDANGRDGSLLLILIVAVAYRLLRTPRRSLMTIVTTVAMTFVSATAVAADVGVYMGISLGHSMTLADDGDISKQLAGRGHSAQVSLDDTDIGWKIVGGYRFNRWFGVEGAIVDLGTFDSSINATVPNPAQLLNDIADVHPYSARGYSATVMGTLPISERLSVFGKAGLFIWQGEVKANAGSFGSVSKDENGVDLTLGLGTSFKITDRIQIRTEWERYFLKRDDIDLISIGMSFHF
jgi:Calx-beta domain/OmpA-like transmembrane domain/Beta-propeller repeat